MMVQSTGAHPQLGDVLEALQDMAQHVAGAMQIAHLHGLHAHGGVRLQHLPPHPLHGRMQGLHRQVHALQGARRRHEVKLHALSDMLGSRRVLPRTQPAESSLEHWATLHADSIMSQDSNFGRCCSATGLACLHESLGLPQALCLLQQTLLAQLNLSRYSVLQQLDTLLQLCCLSLRVAHGMTLHAAWVPHR